MSEALKKFVVRASYKTSPNIALIKYWGKYHEDLIVPLNSSLSMTLNCDDIFTQTKLEANGLGNGDSLTLNNKLTQIPS